MAKYGQSIRTTREVVENKIKQVISERAPMKRNLIVRMGDELHDQLAELAQKMSEEMPGKRVTVSDVAWKPRPSGRGGMAMPRQRQALASS